MRISDQDLDKLVEEAMAAITSRGEKPTIRKLQLETNCNTEDVCKSSNRLKERARAEYKAKLALAINPKIAEAFLADREEQITAHTAAHKDEILSLKEDCDALEEEIGKLRATLQAAETERDETKGAHAEAVKDFSQREAEIKEALQNTLGQQIILQSDLDRERRLKIAADDKLVRLQHALGAKSVLAKAEQLRADNNWSQYQESQRILKETIVAAEIQANELRGQLTELAAQLQLARNDLATETGLRLEAEAAAETFRKKIADMKRQKSSTEVIATEN